MKTYYRGASVQQLLHWESNKYYIFWARVSGIKYPVCNADAPYFNVWLVWLYNILPHYLINCTIFERKIYWL